MVPAWKNGLASLIAGATLLACEVEKSQPMEPVEVQKPSLSLKQNHPASNPPDYVDDYSDTKPGGLEATAAEYNTRLGFPLEDLVSA